MRDVATWTGLLLMMVGVACSEPRPSAEDGDGSSEASGTSSSSGTSSGSTTGPADETTTTTTTTDTDTETTGTVTETSTSTGEITTTTGAESSSSGSGSTGEFADCVPFTIDDLAAEHFELGLTTYETEATTAIGGALPDRFQLAFYSSETGVFDLASDVNDNYQTCSQCIRVAEDLDDVWSPQRWYFQVQGSIDVDDSADPFSGEVHATLTDVVLIEVDIDFTTYISTPIEDGQCLVLDSPLQIDVEL